MSDLAKGFLWFATCALLFVLFTNGAFGQTFHNGQWWTTTHVCHDRKEAVTLADHLAAHGYEGYNELYATMTSCQIGNVPTQYRNPPVYTAYGESWVVFLRIVQGPEHTNLAILLRGDVPQASRGI